MKKLSFLMTLVLAAVLLASCSKNPGGRLIPDNAFAVLRFDVMKTMESTGMRGDDTSVKSQLEMLIKGAGLEKEVRDKLLDILDDPTSTGIDFTEPVYLYFTKGGRDGFEGGLVGATASKGDLADVIKMLEDTNDDISLEEYKSDGVQYARLDRGTAIIFNGDWFYLGAIERGDDWESQVEDCIEDLLDRAAGNNNIEGNEAFQRLCEGKGLMQLGIFGTGYEGMPGISQLKSQLPEDCNLEDIAGIADLSINKGEILFEGEALLFSEAWEKQVKILTPNTIEKSQAKYADADGALAIINIEPKGFFKYIKKFAENVGASASDLEQLDEMKPLFDTLTGTGMVAINSWDDNDGPEVVAYVGTKNSDFLNKLVDESNADDNIITEGPNQYSVPVDYDYDYNDSIADWTMTPTKYMKIGWKNSQTYLLMNSDDDPFTTPRHSFTDVKGIGIYARIAGGLLGQIVGSSDSDMEMVGEAIANIVDNMEIYMESPTKSVFRLTTKKKDQSPIVTIINYVKRHFR